MHTSPTWEGADRVNRSSAVPVAELVAEPVVRANKCARLFKNNYSNYGIIMETKRYIGTLMTIMPI